MQLQTPPKTCPVASFGGLTGVHYSNRMTCSE